MEVLNGFLKNSPTGLQGLQELEEVFGLLERMGTNLDHVDFDPMLARGLSYYTGAIFEVKVHGVSIGSVSGGGRYDNLTGVFGLPGVPGVGFSFGVDRLYDVLEELDLFPTDRMEGTQLLLAHFDQAGFDYALKCLPILRDAGIRTELYPEVCKLKKQLEYASKKDLPFVGICGDEEIASQTLAVKALATGTQETLTLKEVIAKLQAAI
jgi:histidyl-tRNA synthetase